MILKTTKTLPAKQLLVDVSCLAVRWPNLDTHTSCYTSPGSSYALALSLRCTHWVYFLALAVRRRSPWWHAGRWRPAADR